MSKRKRHHHHGQRELENKRLQEFYAYQNKVREEADSRIVHRVNLIPFDGEYIPKESNDENQPTFW